MLDIGFGELLLIMVIGLVVLGPERLPIAVKTVAGWIRALRSLAATVQNELSQELKLQELQESLKRAEKAGLQNLTPELKASIDELKNATEALKRPYQPHISENEFHSVPDSQAVESVALHDDEERISAKGTGDIAIDNAITDQYGTMNPVVVKPSIMTEQNSDSVSDSMSTSLNSSHGNR